MRFMSFLSKVYLFRIFGLNLFEERRRKKKRNKKKSLEKRKRKEKKRKSQLGENWLKARQENRNFIKSCFVFFWRFPRTNSINMATLALLFCFVSPKISEEKTKNKSTSQCLKVTGTHQSNIYNILGFVRLRWSSFPSIRPVIRRHLSHHPSR